MRKLISSRINFSLLLGQLSNPARVFHVAPWKNKFKLSKFKQVFMLKYINCSKLFIEIMYKPFTQEVLIWIPVTFTKVFFDISILKSNMGFWYFYSLHWVHVLTIFSSEKPLSVCIWRPEVEDIPQWFLQLRCGWRPCRDHLWWYQEGLRNG